MQECEQISQSSSLWLDKPSCSFSFTLSHSFSIRASLFVVLVEVGQILKQGFRDDLACTSKLYTGSRSVLARSTVCVKSSFSFRESMMSCLSQARRRRVSAVSSLIYSLIMLSEDENRSAIERHRHCILDNWPYRLIAQRMGDPLET